MFMRKVFVSHYCHIPFHLLDQETNKIIQEGGTYPQIMIEELYAASYQSMRNFELSPFNSDSSLEDLIADRVERGIL